MANLNLNPLKGPATFFIPNGEATMKCKIASVLYALIVAPSLPPVAQPVIEPPPALVAHQLIATPPREVFARSRATSLDGV
jgi:hypothetical protein